MGQKTNLSLRVPVNIGSANWGERVLKSYLRNAKIAYRQESKKLEKESRQHALNIYNLVIKAFYNSYTPTVYTRHGNIAGFNLYYPYGLDINTKIAYTLDTGKLLPYGFGDGGVERPTRDYVYLNVLRGVRMMPRLRRDPLGTKRLVNYMVPYRYKLKVSYPYFGGRSKSVFTGTPKQILEEAATSIVKHYNRELIFRMRKAIMGLNENLAWVN